MASSHSLEATIVQFLRASGLKTGEDVRLVSDIAAGSRRVADARTTPAFLVAALVAGLPSEASDDDAFAMMLDSYGFRTPAQIAGHLQATPSAVTPSCQGLAHQGHATRIDYRGASYYAAVKMQGVGIYDTTVDLRVRAPRPG